jgi:hypothetical protein
MDDTELMNSAMANEPKQQPAVEERQPEPDNRPRDEHGRFAPKTEQEQPEEPVAAQQEAPAQPQQPTDDDKSGHVPSWRLREVREAREAAERRAEQAERERMADRQQMAAMQRQLEQLQKPKQEPVDFFQNPDEAFQQRLSPIEERQAQFESRMRLNVSRAMAIATHGAPAVTEMEQAIDKASRENHPDIQALAAQMRASDDPVNVAMNWHKRSKLFEATGGDIDGYKAKLSDDLLKDPTFLAKALEAARTQAGQPGTRPAINLPPSLNRAPGSGVSAAELDANDMSDASLYRHATTSGRR